MDACRRRVAADAALSDGWCIGWEVEGQSQASAVVRSHSIGVSDRMVGLVMTGMPERWAFRAASSSAVLNTGWNYNGG